MSLQSMYVVIFNLQPFRRINLIHPLLKFSERLKTWRGLFKDVDKSFRRNMCSNPVFMNMEWGKCMGMSALSL